MRLCDACGVRTPEGARFCPACGVPLGAPQLESRRRVTVLFSDLAGSTQLGERLDPEALRRVMARYFEEMRAVIERHGGVVEKFIGDAVTAVFGIPARHEDDALRAVRAALDMRASQERLNGELDERFGVRLRVRTGVNTGEVVAGDPGLGQAFVVGDAVNVAARLEQVAAEGEILVGAETERLVREHVRVEAGPPLELKGKSAPVAAFRLLGLAAAPPAPPLSAFVGRADELAALRTAFERSIVNGRCERLTLIGPPGMGKSRLVRELERELGARARFLHGRCLSYGDGGTYWPIAEIVRSAARIRLGEPREVARGRLEELVAADGERDAVAGLVASLIGLDDAPQRPEESSWAFRRLAGTLSARGPLVLVLDDLQWAEDGLFDLLADLSRLEAPVLLLCVARPELPETRAAAERSTVVRLAPLGDVDSHRLVDALAEGVAPDVSDLIARTARGNPLFVVELLRSLIEEGRVERRDGTLVAVGLLGAPAVPPTLEALLAARLERLNADERTIAECASVVGEEFEHEEVRELAPDTVRPALASCLAGLVRNDVIAAADTDAFRFAHLLIRDVAYDGMLKERRAELHERFADWLERHAGERIGEIEDIVGHHLAEAYRHRAALGTAGERELPLARRAAGHLIAAGHGALARLDRAGAVRLFRSARELLPPDDLEGLEAGLEIAYALAESHQGEEAQREARAVVLAAEAAGEHDLALRARLEEVELRSWTEPASGALVSEGLPEQAIERFEATGDRRGLARAWWVLGMQHLGAARNAAAAQAIGVALEHARAAGDVRMVRELWQWHAWITLLWSDLPAGEAIRRCDGLLAEARGRPFDELHVRIGLMFLHFIQQRPDDARDLRRQILAVVDELNLAREASLVDMLSGYGEWLAGDVATAEAQMRRAFDSVVVGSRWTPGLDLAQLLIDQSRLDEAEWLCDQAAADTIEEDVEDAIAWRAAKATVLAHRGRIAEAEQLGREAVRLSEPTDTWGGRSCARLALARVLAHAGRRDEAAEAFAETIEIFERKEHLAGAARARALRGALLAVSSPHERVPRS
jgi:class 3 adenylate cyclase/tetratricopeptide (TPR) repeat protein